MHAVLSREFDDADDLCELVRGWDLDLRQVARGRFTGDLLQLVGERVQLARARFGRPLEQRGAPPEGSWTFGVPAMGCSPFLWRGSRVGPSEIVVFPPGTELDSVSREGFAVYTFSMTGELLEQAAQRVGARGLGRTLQSASAVTCPGPAIARLRRTLGAVCQMLESAPPGPVPGEPRRELEDGIPALLIEALDARGGAPRRAPAADGPRDRALERALACVAEHGGDSPTVEELSRAAGVSPRSLRRAFLDRYGVPPKTYLVGHRLDRLRRELRRSDPDATKVVDVANRCGFWHMGQLAADYRRQFGELPSQTLSRRRGAGTLGV